MGYRGRMIVKSDIMSVRDINWGLEKGNLSLDCALQRESDQWTTDAKSNQISDMLQSREFPNLTFFEIRSEDGTKMSQVIDGKQRITNFQSYISNGWAISKKVRRYNIDYQVKIGLDCGRPVYEWKTIDIRGKKYRDLPEELQMELLQFTWHVNIDIDGTNEDLQYEIERLNDGKAMNSNQKAIVKLGIDYAEKIKKVANSEFFNDGKFKASEEKKNAYERMCVDSLMAIGYLEDWKKSTTDNASYIALNANDGDFDVFADEVSRLQNVVTKETATLFTAKDAHVWLALFDKFVNLELPDERFKEFLDVFVTDLHSKRVDGISYDMLLEDRRTRDKSTVCEKIVHLYDVMTEYLNVETDGDDMEAVREIAATYVPVVEMKEVA